MKEIPIKEIPGFRIGNAEYEEAATGCTVVLADPAATGAQSIRGGAPASRESALLSPMADNSAVNAVLLSGGSAFGLNAAGGVMRYLEERNTGFPTSAGVVPIVCASCLFDLTLVRGDIRPDDALGYQACRNAETNNYKDGSYGAGCGASVGKILGPETSMKAGIGSYAVRSGELEIGCIAAVNAAGDIYDYHTGKKIAGILSPKDSEEILFDLQESPDLFKQNTTISVILTNADLSKAELAKAADMANDGYARTIRPVHTMFDGDSITILSTRKVKTDVTTLGSLAAMVTAEAIMRAARPAGNTYGLKAAKEENE